MMKMKKTMERRKRRDIVKMRKDKNGFGSRGVLINFLGG
jgi:hypothetical protein